MTGLLLPARVDVAEGEALDSHLERLAAANDLPTATMFRLVSTQTLEEPAPVTAFFMVKPHPTVIARISAVAGLEDRAVERMALVHYDKVMALGLVALDQRDRHTYREVVARGWFPPHGTQACPCCLRRDGIWKLVWRLPVVMACPRHRCYLSPSCAGCGRRYRERRHNPLRPSVWPDPGCGNPLGAGAHCPTSADEADVGQPPEHVLRVAGRIEKALGGDPQPVAGTLVPATAYLAELKHLAVLLCHIASFADTARNLPWSEDLRAEAALRRTGRRGPRWGMQPPDSTEARGGALALADRILSDPEIASGAAALREQTSLLVGTCSGPLNWVRNRTVLSPAVKLLVELALEPGRGVGALITRSARDSVGLSTRTVPQLLDRDLYREFFAELLATREDTGRLYASLCVVRARQPALSWRTAADALGLHPDVGRRTARAASKSFSGAHLLVAQAARRCSEQLSPKRDFRQIEERVRQLARRVDEWFPGWARSCAPRRRRSAVPYAITWLWCEQAQGWLDMSPAWPAPPTRQLKAAYRAFCDSVPPQAVEHLKDLVTSRK